MGIFDRIPGINRLPGISGDPGYDLPTPGGVDTGGWDNLGGGGGIGALLPGDFNPFMPGIGGGTQEDIFDTLGDVFIGPRRTAREQILRNSVRRVPLFLFTITSFWKSSDPGGNP